MNRTVNRTTRRLLLGLSAFGLVLHLALTVWALVQPSAAPLVGRLQTPLLLLFSLSHGAYLLGGRPALVFFVLSVVISWLFEQVGVATGLVYGRYHYSDLLQPWLGHVPLVIPMGWFMMMYPSYIIAQLIVTGKPTGLPRPGRRLVWLAFLAAATMTAWDLAVDPVLSGHGLWVWEEGGAYFGVPIHNFAGWLVTTFAIYLAYLAWARQVEMQPMGPVTAPIVWMPLLAYASQILRMFGEPALGLIAAFAMGLPLLIAAGRLHDL